MILFALLWGVVIGVAILTAFTLIFLAACRMAKVPHPGFSRAAIVVVATAVIWTVVEAIFHVILKKVYAVFGGPPWEVWIVALFAGFPVSLAVGTWLHRVLMTVPYQKAIEVWFFERLIRYGIGLVFGGAILAVWLVFK